MSDDLRWEAFLRSIGPRVANAITGDGWGSPKARSFEDLMNLTEAELWRIPSLGRKSIDLIFDMMARCGFEHPHYVSPERVAQRLKEKTLSREEAARQREEAKAANARDIRKNRQGRALDRLSKAAKAVLEFASEEDDLAEFEGSVIDNCREVVQRLQKHTETR